MHVDTKLEEANAAIRKLAAPPSEDPERVMRNLCRNYFSEIDRYTQCHDQRLFQYLKKGFADLILAIAETKPNFHITFEGMINHGQDNGNGINIPPQILLDDARTPLTVDGETLVST
jgi:hypothetical protein